jgi:hypothetical protein
MRLSDIDWGNDSAERDPNLLQYYVTPSDYDRLLAFRKFLVIGRKGSGKSAIRRKLLSDFSSKGNHYVCDICPTFNMVKPILQDRQLRDNFGDELFFQYAWLRHLMAEVFSTIGSGRGGTLLTGSYAEARDFAAKRGRITADLLETVRHVLSTVKLKAGSLGELGIDAERILREAAELDYFEYHIKQILADGNNIVALVDDLDIGWDNSDLGNQYLLGVLLAANYLNALSASLRVYLFLREDIYRLLMQRTQHSDKYREIVDVRWTPAQLQMILESRIRYSIRRRGLSAPLDLFHAVFPAQVGVTNTMTWLANRTLGRPRELLQLSRLYTEGVPQSSPDVNVLKGVEERYSRWKLDDLCTEFSNQYPELRAVFEYWKVKFARCKYSLEWHELEEMLLDILANLNVARPWYEAIQKEVNTRRFAEILWEIGFLGDFILGGEGGSRTIYSADVHTPRFQQVQIHQCFRKAIGTVDRIRK